MPEITTHIARTNERENESRKRNACLVGQILYSAEREYNNLDQYLRLQDNHPTGWAIGSHLYDRLLEPNLFKLSRSRFFTAPYLGDRIQQALSGCVVGPLNTTIMAKVLSLTLAGVCAPWYFIGFCCLPSIAYLEKGLRCIKIAITGLACNGHLSEEQSLLIKINLQCALSCFILALLMPLAWAASFPLEMVRFITRSVSTAIEIAKACLVSVCFSGEVAVDITWSAGPQR